MGVDPYRAKKNPLELSPEHQFLLKLMVEHPHETDAWFAEQCGVNRTTIHNWKFRPLFQAALREAMKPAIKIIEESQPKAARILRKKLESEDETVQIKAAGLILKPILEPTNNLNILNQEGGQILIRWANSPEEAKQLREQNS
jgi:hypothetical protein